MKITKLIGDGLNIEDGTILSVWDYEETDSILLEYINHSELDYDRDKQVLNIDRNQLLLSESTPFKYDFREENSDTYFYN
ncbi:hypothetical protein [Staphylococcus aureus]|uniref:hypothetical protein n=1 Tax=Staphylococcus aureus TaxID=1280 RepID=UPI000F3C20B8|nr:hypothetical protein [Staphylococcus aureus]RNG65146.1 hypothetical protein D1G04_13875 [Staphylococcus aureus]